MFLANNLNKGGSLGGYQISRSLRFNRPDSAYLSRTPASAGNRKAWTMSFWVKRSDIVNRQIILEQFLSASDTGYCSIEFASDAAAPTLVVGGYNTTWRVTTQVFRDVSAWYHIVVAVDTTLATANNRVRIYLNGSEITSFSTLNNPTQNADTGANSTGPAGIGSATSGGSYLNGYLTEIYMVDGQQLTPSSFGETNAQTGVWQPKAFVGTYGTNGFYLNFSDNSNTTAATLGKDYSGNGNNWTPNNFSVTAGAGNDSLVDSPTSYGTDTGVGGTVRGNYCTWNPLRVTSNVILSNGNLSATSTVSGNKFTSSTLGLSSGKWYWEITLSNSGECLIGVENGSAPFTDYLGQSTNGWSYDTINGQVYTNAVGSAYGATLTTNDVLGIALDVDAGKIWFSKNGTWQNSGSPTGGTNAAFSGLPSLLFPAVTPYGNTSGCDANFGQRPFAYTAPSGFKALCTQNLPTPTIGATTATQAGLYFNPVLYTGTGATLSVTGSGFQPDLVWIKQRNGARNHNLYDAVRGTLKVLQANVTDAEVNYAGSLTSFDSNGFSLGTASDVNVNGNTYVAWNWKANGSGSTNTAGSITSTVSANTTSGFSIVTYTGNGTGGATVGHGLGVAPSMVICKTRTGSSVGAWQTYHSALGATKTVFLNLTDAAYTNILYWNNTAPTSSVFTIGANTDVNTITNTYVAYCFAEVAGYSKFGSYTGNSSSDGPFVFCGFKPAYVMIKLSSTGATADWIVEDGTRNPYNVADAKLSPNTSGAEYVGASAVGIDFLSNGFKIRGTDGSVNTANTYIFAAFASAPFKYSLAR